MTRESDSLKRAQELVSRAVKDYTDKRLTYYLRRPDLLVDLLKKDPLLPALRGISTASDWVADAFRAHESSSEETMMGNAWQQILTDLSINSVGAGDLLFEKDDMLWVVEMKTQTNTLNGSSRPQTLKVLKRKVLEHSRTRTPRVRGVMALLGVLRGKAKDAVETVGVQPPENKEIEGFQYRYMVGSPFRSWLTGFTDPADLIQKSREPGMNLAEARSSCEERLRLELHAMLESRGLPDDIESVIDLAAEIGVRRS